MKVPARDSKYSFNLKIFKFHDKKTTQSQAHNSLTSTVNPVLAPAPMISTKRNSWRASWRAAIGVGPKGKSSNTFTQNHNKNNNNNNNNNIEDESRKPSICESRSELNLDLNERIPHIDDLMCKYKKCPIQSQRAIKISEHLIHTNAQSVIRTAAR